MYQHTRLYELSVSTKMLLTGFILTICTAAALGVVAFQQFAQGADGDPALSLRDIRLVTCGSEKAILEAAADAPSEFGLENMDAAKAKTLRDWCHDGAPLDGAENVMGIIEGSSFDRPPGLYSADGTVLPEAYSRIAALARPSEAISAAQLATGTALYLAIVSLAFLGMGLMVVRTSLFERTKVFFVGATFAVAAACPLCLWLGRGLPEFLYLMLLSGLLLAVCLGVFALVALSDLWFRRPAT